MVQIPLDANPFYVSDSYTIPLSAPAPGFLRHYPGVANQDGIIPAGKIVTIYIQSASLVSLPIGADQPQGVNTDLQIGLYDISTGKAVFKTVASFGSPFGSAANGQVINQVSKVCNNTPRAWREFGKDSALVMRAVAPTTGQYQVGAAFQFNYGVPNLLVQYEYHLFGAWTVS